MSMIIFNKFLIMGGLFMALQSFADVQNDITDSLGIKKDSVMIDSFANMISSNQEKIQELTNKIGDLTAKVDFSFFIIVILLVLVLIFGTLTLLLVRGKLKRQKHGLYRSLESELDEVKSTFKLDSQRKANDIEAVKASLKSLEHGIEELGLKINFEEKNVRQIEQDKTIHKDTNLQTQYLKANNEGDFFFEGNDSSDGCQFKITFTSKANGNKGELSVIVDIDNLKCIPIQFLKQVVHVINNVSYKEARGMLIVNNGICEYQLEDGFGIWKIKKPIEIKLNK